MLDDDNNFVSESIIQKARFDVHIASDSFDSIVGFFGAPPGFFEPYQCEVPYEKMISTRDFLSFFLPRLMVFGNEKAVNKLSKFYFENNIISNEQSAFNAAMFAWCMIQMGGFSALEIIDDAINVSKEDKAFLVMSVLHYWCVSEIAHMYFSHFDPDGVNNEIKNEAIKIHEYYNSEILVNIIDTSPYLCVCEIERPT